MTDLHEDERTVISDLTRAALEVAAPEEVAVFDANRDRYLEGRAPTGTRGLDQQLGFGVEVIAMLTPYVVAAASAAVKAIVAAFADSATAEAKGAVSDWMHRLIHHEKGGAAEVALPADLLQRVHQITYDVCSQMGADPADATRVSDAVAGRLATS